MNPLRMQQIFGNKSPVKQESNYPMYNEFLRSIAPMLHARRREAEGRENAELDTQRSIGNQAIPSPIEQRLPIQQEEKPMNVRFDPSGGRGMTPYQEAQLALSGRRIEQGGDIADRRMDLAEAGGSRLDQIAAQGKLRGEQIDQSGKIALNKQDVVGTQNIARDQARENAANQRQERAAQIATELANLKDAHGVEAAKVKADLERELIDLRGAESRETKLAPSYQAPMPPSQQRIESLNRAQAVVNAHPEWQEFVKMDKGGFIIKPSGDPRVDEQIKAAIYGKGDIALPSDTTVKNTTMPVTQTPVVDKPPAGSDPGGKWVVTKSGRRIWMNP